MNRLYHVSILLLLIMFTLPGTVFSNDNIPDSLKGYINTLSQKVKFKTIQMLKKEKCPEIISSNEALIDINMIEYLFETSYSGLDFWKNKGISFQNLYSKLRELARKSNTVKIIDIEKIILAELNPIIDCHLAFKGHRWHRFNKHFDSYFTDLVIEKKNNNYIVIASEIDNIKIGSKYIGNTKYLFKTLAPPSKNYFLVGTQSFTYTPEMKLEFDGFNSTVPLHSCRLAKRSNNSDIYAQKIINGYNVIKVGSFATKYHKQLDQYSESGSKLKDQSVIILDVTNNSGGSSSYSKRFFTNLNGVAHWLKTGGALESPAILQSWSNLNKEKSPPYIKNLIDDSRRELKRARTNPIKFWKLGSPLSTQATGKFKGKVITLVNRWVASSGEATVAFSKSVSDNLLIGENTAGMGTFGEVRTYILKHSKILFALPSKLFIAEDSKEGYGYIPNYWLDTDKPVDAITSWIAKPKTYMPQLGKRIKLNNIDFEVFQNGIPENMTMDIGARTGEGPYSKIIQDTKIFNQGKSSLCIETNGQTRKFYSLEIKIPQNIKRLNYSYEIKGEGLQRQGRQFNNCYVGIMYRDVNGKYNFKINNYIGDFDWKKETKLIDLEKLDAYDASFNIFLSISGKLWIDDLKFNVIK
ncbi:hypothetical protein KAJ27_03335 [bacterium]|nr:hypothetical protein [bacterium]